MRPLRWLPALLFSGALACGSTQVEPTGVTSSAGGAGSGGASGGGGTSAAGGGVAGGEPEVPSCNRGPKSHLCNPFGVALDGGGMANNTYWDLLDEVFRVHFYRPDPIELTTFANDPASCPRCDEAVARGLYLILPVRNAASAAEPGAPPLDMDAYRALVSDVIARYQGSIALLVVESEPDDPAAYAGTPAQYLAQLAAACDEAHKKGVHCADGGASSTGLLLAVARYYADFGNLDEPLRILRTAEGNPVVPPLFTSGQATVADVAPFLASFAERIDRTEQLLAGVRAAGVDVANFHWFEASETTLDEVVALVRNRTACFRVATLALGQRTLDPFETEAKLGLTRDLGMLFVIWASRDTGGLRSLVDPDGALRPTGERLAQLSAATTCVD